MLKINQLVAELELSPAFFSQSPNLVILYLVTSVGDSSTMQGRMLVSTYHL